MDADRREHRVGAVFGPGNGLLVAAGGGDLRDGVLRRERRRRRDSAPRNDRARGHHCDLRNVTSRTTSLRVIESAQPGAAYPGAMVSTQPAFSSRAAALAAHVGSNPALWKGAARCRSGALHRAVSSRAWCRPRLARARGMLKWPCRARSREPDVSECALLMDADACGTSRAIDSRAVQVA